MDELITLEFDGGSRGNPGHAGIGIVLRAADGTPLVTLGRYIGRATNNVAEYQALIVGLQKALELGAKKLQIRGDSELIIKQMKGEYRVRHPELKPLHDEARQLISNFKEARLEHNLRHKNTLADKLANLAMDKKREVTEAEDDSPLDEPSPAPAAAGDRLECMCCGMVIEVRTPSSLRPHQLRPLTCQCGQKMTDGRP
ncbi:MAG TPA: ribonuclease HI family protein [Tepidisphaeraceae bacterium]|jgi:ribonuclease HI|nr:ribonuclease HI family protein [Tepidisphaeraceae bacterium]